MPGDFMLTTDTRVILVAVILIAIILVAIVRHAVLLIPNLPSGGFTDANQ